MSRAVKTFLPLLLLAGCQPATVAKAPEPEQPAPSPAPSAGGCDTAPVLHLVGEALSTALSEKMRVMSSSRAVRTIRPGMAVTMEYREDRLNIYVSESGRITRLSCG